MAAQPSSPASGRETFKTYLRKVGSGEHTSKGLSREEARHALELILDEEATPAQIGAFLIAHRIRRPEPQELTGMLDVYRQRGPKLSTTTKAISFGMPFDGRSRTAPIYPLTALLLAAAGLPVVLQGAGRMPVKYGVSSAELFSSLGVNWTGRNLETLQQCLDATNLALVHQPDHFPAAESLIPYREDLGKRPPVASLELLWTAHQGEHLLVSGFVHPPTEARAWEALKLADEPDVMTVKGLEGSTDLPISRACVTARCSNNQQQRQILHPRDHGCYGHDQLWEGLDVWSDQARAALGGQGELATALLWNAGTYLWQAGCEDSLEQGLEHARELLNSGQALNHLGAVQAALAQG